METMLLQIANFGEFVSWLFSAVTLGAVSLFWWWISSTVRSVNRELEALKGIVSDMRILQNGSKVERVNIVKELEKSGAERSKIFNNLSILRAELASLKAKIELLFNSVEHKH